MKETQVPSLNQEDPLEEDLAAHSSILIRKSHGQELGKLLRPQGHHESVQTECMCACARKYTHTLLHTRLRPQLVIVLIKGVVRGVRSTGFPGN